MNEMNEMNKFTLLEHAKKDSHDSLFDLSVPSRS